MACVKDTGIIRRRGLDSGAVLQRATKGSNEGWSKDGDVLIALPWQGSGVAGRAEIVGKQTREVLANEMKTVASVHCLLLLVLLLALQARSSCAFVSTQRPFTALGLHTRTLPSTHRPRLRRLWQPLQATAGDLTGDGGVVKNIFVYGDEAVEQALDGDVVHLTLSGTAHHADGTQATICCRARSAVQLGARRGRPRQLPLGLELCVKSMFSGEECEVELSPKYSGPLVTPNYTLPTDASTTWRVRLRQIDLNPMRLLTAKPPLESEATLRTFKDPLIHLATANRYAHESPRKVEMFNPVQHKIHPQQRVDGIAPDESYRWQETPQKLEVLIPIPNDLTAKDLNVTITGRHIHVSRRSANNNTVLLEGPLHDYVVASQCAWTITGGEAGAQSELYIFLQKGPAAQDLWGTVLFDPEQQASAGAGSYLQAPIGSLPPLPTTRYPDDTEAASPKSGGGLSDKTIDAQSDVDGGGSYNVNDNGDNGDNDDDNGTDFDLFGQLSQRYTEEEIKNAIRIRVGFDERPDETGRSQIVLRTDDGKEYIGNDNKFGIKTIAP